MRTKTLLACLLFTCCGCASDPLLPGPTSDAGAIRKDAAASIDFPTVDCTAVGTDEDHWLTIHASCLTDADCETITTACGIQGQCGAFVNHSARGAYLDGLVASWNNSCNPPDCTCPGGLPAAGCNNGICGIKMTGTHPIGDPCQAGSDCLTGACVTEKEMFGFSGGYCTIRDCDKSGPCPMGSECKPIGNTSYCLKTCPINQMTCRVGYRCCTGPGPALGPGGCAPEMSTFCTAK